MNITEVQEFGEFVGEEVKEKSMDEGLRHSRRNPAIQ